MNDERDRGREGLPPPTAPYLPVQTGGAHVTHHGRLRGQQWGSGSALEVGTPAVRRSHRTDPHGVSLPPRDEQVEPDRAPTVLAHCHELARETAGEPGGHCQSDRSHHFDVGTPSAIGTRQRAVPRWSPGVRRADGADPPGTSQVPRGLELHHPTPPNPHEMSQLFSSDS